MISKHIDLIALAILLLAVSIFSTAKNVAVLTMQGPVRYFHVQPNHKVRIPRISIQHVVSN